MTNKELEKIAARVAEVVLNSLAEKQKQWDKEFYEEFNGLKSDAYIAPDPELTEEQKLLAQLKTVQEVKLAMLEREQYLFLSEVEAEIASIKFKLEQLKNKP